jgi:hypothetical protein
VDFILSQHAQEEINKRKIPLQIVQLILNYPEQILEEDGLKVYQGIFTGTNHKTYLLRIYVNDLVSPQKIVTLYITSKINKYRRFIQ